MNTTYLLLGGNIGERGKILKKAISEIDTHIGKILKKSSVYETKAWGKERQPNFLNQVILLKTSYSPDNLLKKVLSIEKTLGRKRTGKKWEKRIIDIDILFYNDLVSEKKKLKIPHPYLHLRRFTLTPLNEIAHNFVHPVFKKTIAELLTKCGDELQVVKVSNDVMHNISFK